MISYSSNQVLVRAPSSFQSAEEIRAALRTAGLLEVLFSGFGVAGHWGFVGLEELGGNCLDHVRVWLLAV